MLRGQSTISVVLIESEPLKERKEFDARWLALKLQVFWPIYWNNWAGVSETLADILSSPFRNSDLP